MAQYTFRYILGGSAPFKTLPADPADTDAEARKKVLAFVATIPGAELVENSIEYYHVEHRRIPAPPQLATPEPNPVRVVNELAPHHRGLTTLERIGSNQ